MRFKCTAPQTTVTQTPAEQRGGKNHAGSAQEKRDTPATVVREIERGWQGDGGKEDAATKEKRLRGRLERTR